MSGSNLLGYHPILGSTSTSASNNNVSGVEYLLNNGGLDKVMVENLKKLEPEDRTRCLQCSKASVVALVKQYANEISCSGCVRTLLSTLNGSLFENQSSHSHSKSTGILSAIISEVDNDGGFRLRPQWESSIETVGKLFKVFNDSSYLSRRSNNGKRHRCSLHAVSSRVDIDCESLWRDMPLYLRKRTACLRVEELTEALSKHLKNLYFCRDCRGNVQRALEILISNADVEDADIDDSFCEEYFVPFQLESRDDDYFTDEDEQEYVTHSLDLDHDHDHDHEHNPSHDHYHDNCAECGDGHDEFQHEHHENECDEDCDCEYLDDDEHDDDEVFMDDHHHHNGKCCYEGADCELIGQPSHVSCALRQVPHLIRRAVEADERDEVARAKGQSSDRHAPTLKEGQSELLNCIGKLLQTRMRDSWIMHLVKRQTDEILLWLILSCMRTNVERVIQYNVGNEALISLLEEEADNIKKSKKKKKKKKKKHRERRDKERDEGGKKKINVLSLKFEENAVQSMTSSHNEKEDSSIAEEEDKYMSGVGPQRPAQIIDYNYIHGDNTDKNSNNRDNPWGGQSFGSRYMDRDVQNYLESGGDISKLAQHPQFSHLNGADVEKEAKLKAMEISADGSGTAGMGEDRPAVSTFWNVKEGKMTTGFINNTMGKRKHQIGSLVQEAEQFEAELERQKVKSRKGMQKARNMYGF
mmetsp:Transcript_20775/g.26473  ORF Transcript_20775/g.26473 Transcript_20775/m.26473 type:complete len:697 (+) Transcript_20775:363-2453(+)